LALVAICEEFFQYFYAKFRGFFSVNLFCETNVFAFLRVHNSSRVGDV